MALRHLPRTHTIDVRWLFEVCSQPRVRMTYTNTKQQIADLMTKAITRPDTWAHLLDIAQIRPGPLIGSTVTTKCRRSRTKEEIREDLGPPRLRLQTKRSHLFERQISAQHAVSSTFKLRKDCALVAGIEDPTL